MIKGRVGHASWGNDPLFNHLRSTFYISFTDYTLIAQACFERFRKDIANFYVMSTLASSIMYMDVFRKSFYGARDAF
jgi:hypothetical protein